jgi:SH3-like domain-containing protein
MHRHKVLVMMVMAALACGAGAPAAWAKTELGLPRYVSLKSGEVNVRTGPGLRYQIKWVIKREHLPLEVIAEFEQWRKVRDMDGEEGWLHSSMLTGQRRVMIIGEDVTIRTDAAAEAAPVAKIQKGAVADLEECTKAFCHIESGEYEGWVERNAVWGVYPDEWPE